MPIACVCAVCEKSFSVPPSRIRSGRGRYCSDACRHIGHRKTLDERFWSKVDKMPDERCWLWVGHRDERGYGRLGQRETRAPLYAHRLSYELSFGPIPDGMSVCHHCDNPSCVNPTHLFLGDQRANTQDRDAKGRTRQGSKHANAKLNEEQVAAIRAVYAAGGVSRLKLARVYGVSHGTMDALLAGLTWKSVP